MIDIVGLTKRYGDKLAVNNISFHINEGEVVGFLGANGAGKSTTMNILTGFLSSSDGTVKINGVDILDDPIEAKKNIGYLPELPPLYQDMTVQEYLEFVCDLKSCKLPKKQHIDEICSVVKISDVQHRLIRNLSKGYRQRVGLAQALVNNPKVIILDEPTVGLDPRQIIDMRKLIKALGKDHTIILSTHILPEAQAVCDRILIIDKGSLIADAKTEDVSMLVNEHHRLTAKICGPADKILSELRAMPGVADVQILPMKDGDASVFQLEAENHVDIRKPLFKLLAEKSWYLIGLETAGTSLEDIFIKLTNRSKEVK